MVEASALVLTFNEEENIVRVLTPLAGIPELLLVDSGSTDRTLELARSVRPDIKIATRVFDSFAAQCNFGLSQLQTEWVLSLDADYIPTPELVDEIDRLTPPEDVAGYSVEFNYCIYGHRLRNTVYPPRTVLYRRRLAEYRDEGHGHRVQVSGRVLSLRGKIDHDDRKPLTQWLQSQDRYAIIEARHLLRSQKFATANPSSGGEEGGRRKAEEGDGKNISESQHFSVSAFPERPLSIQDRLRLKIFFAAPAMFLYLLIGRGLILDGWPGWYYVFQRTIAEMLLSLRLLTEREGLEEG